MMASLCYAISILDLATSNSGMVDVDAIDWTIVFYHIFSLSKKILLKQFGVVKR